RNDADAGSNRANPRHAQKVYADFSLGDVERLPVRPLGVKRDVVAPPVGQPPRAQPSSPERGHRLAAGSTPEPGRCERSATRSPRSPGGALAGGAPAGDGRAPEACWSWRKACPGSLA